MARSHRARELVISDVGRSGDRDEGVASPRVASIAVQPQDEVVTWTRRVTRPDDPQDPRHLFPPHRT